ncbi:MAG: diacylglycerol kinase family protein [Dethiobacter sp.]|jgi:diacylglycerol kinase (ATP)|nr:MAG: diacylglycerol kinase family protein [Dethiobacter sp.]
MKHTKLIKSFRDAFRGIIYAFRSERNLHLHLIGTVVALAASFYLKVEKFELLFVVTAIFLVFITEMINTAVEATVDLKTKQFHPLARIAKNVAAGAVLCAALFALVVAYVVFADRLKNLW